MKASKRKPKRKNAGGAARLDTSAPPAPPTEFERWAEQIIQRDGALGWFSGVMHEKLCEPRNISKGGWSKTHVLTLFSLLKREVDELRTAIDQHLAGEIEAREIVKECADVANFALFIAHNAEFVDITTR